MTVVAHRVLVRGRVQGVFFRDSTRREAATHAVVGWVRNRPDGTVEAWLEGAGDDVAAIEDWMRRGGPRAASVEQVQIEERDPAGYDRFRVTH